MRFVFVSFLLLLNTNIELAAPPAEAVMVGQGFLPRRDLVGEQMRRLADVGMAETCRHAPF